MTEIEKIIEWVRANAVVSDMSDENLIHAYYKDFLFRIFPLGEYYDNSEMPWIGVIKEGGTFSKANAFYKFDAFLEYVQSD